MAGKSEQQCHLKVAGLQIGYQQPLLEKSVDFSVDHPALVAIVGVNGIGKSTLLKTIGGLQNALDGQILINKRPFTSMRPREKAFQLSMVLTEAVSSRNLRVAELVSLGRHPFTNWLGNLGKEDKKAVQFALEVMELEDLKNEKCITLSDGQLQRVLIARAIAQDTPLMLLDEPTTHLDLYHKVKIVKALREITENLGKIILFTTHEINLAIQLADYMLILDKHSHFGAPCELIEQGHFENLFPGKALSFDPNSGAFIVNK